VWRGDVGRRLNAGHGRNGGEFRHITLSLCVRVAFRPATETDLYYRSCKACAGAGAGPSLFLSLELSRRLRPLGRRCRLPPRSVR
jgi:hypothetical protein